MDNELKPIVKITTAAATDHDVRKEEDAVPADGNGVASAATATGVTSPVAADCDGDGAGLEEAESQPSQQSSARTPFTDLSQVDADWALARYLQEQERAYMMLRMNNDGSHYGSWEAASYLNDDDEDFEDPYDDHEEDDDESEVEDGIGGTHDGTDIDDKDAFDVHANDHAADDNAAVELGPDAFLSDDAFARALLEAEEREMAARMLALAGINDQEVEDGEDYHGNAQDNWEDVDPDELSYEELLALGEMVGTESRGLSADTIASLASVSYKAGSSQHGTNDLCVICCLGYEDGDTLTVLSCKHSYHHECINDWLQMNKVCPVCKAEVTAFLNS